MSEYVDEIIKDALNYATEEGEVNPFLLEEYFQALIDELGERFREIGLKIQSIEWRWEL